MTKYYRVMLGKASMYFEECFKGNFIGADYGIGQDLAKNLPEDWRKFNKEFIPIYLQNRPDKSKIAAGLACGMLWTLSKGMNIGDIVLCPDGNKVYHLGEITSDYYYQPDGILPHRRQVKWLETTISRADMSQNLQYATGAIGLLSDVSQYASEIEKFINPSLNPHLVVLGEEVEDVQEFALEEHLQRFLITNWERTSLGKEYDIFKKEGVGDGSQFKADNGWIDILAISKDHKVILVVELKKGRASDVVVGQTLRYMGYVKEELAEPDQQVKGLIIAHEDNLAIRRALAIVKDIKFQRYSVSFKLIEE